jgi:hypothetical protein
MRLWEYYEVVDDVVFKYISFDGIDYILWSLCDAVETLERIPTEEYFIDSTGMTRLCPCPECIKLRNKI